MACRIQRTWFNFIQIRKLRRFFRALKLIQNMMKVRFERKKFRLTINNTKKIQRAFQKKQFRKGVTVYFEKLDKMKEASTRLSSFAKMMKAKSMYIQKKSRINDIIRLVRGFLARRYVNRFRICRKILHVSIYFEINFFLRKNDKKRIKNRFFSLNFFSLFRKINSFQINSSYRKLFSRKAGGRFG